MEVFLKTSQSCSIFNTIELNNGLMQKKWKSKVNLKITDSLPTLPLSRSTMTYIVLFVYLFIFLKVQLDNMYDFKNSRD